MSTLSGQYRVCVCVSWELLSYTQRPELACPHPVAALAFIASSAAIVGRLLLPAWNYFFSLLRLKRQI
jgi:hypothetical protein